MDLYLAGAGSGQQLNTGRQRFHADMANREDISPINL